MSIFAFGLLFILGFLLTIISSVTNWVQSFQESLLWGLAYTFLPFAAIVFIIMFWGKLWVRRAFLGGIGGMLLMIASLFGFVTTQPDAWSQFQQDNPAFRGPIGSDSDQTASIPPDLQSDKTDRFYSGVKQATTAATLTQTAQSKADWKIIATHWSQAIALMKAVPTDHPKHDVAQTKVAEYQKNLAYAQKNAI